MASPLVMLPAHAGLPGHFAPVQRLQKRNHVETPSTMKRFRAEVQAPAPTRLSTSLVHLSIPPTAIQYLPAFLPTRYTIDPTQYPSSFHFGTRPADAAPSVAKVELLEDVDVDSSPVVLKPLKTASKALKESGILSIPRPLPTQIPGALITVDPRSQQLKERLAALAKLTNANNYAIDSLPDAEEVEDDALLAQELQSMEM